MIREAIRQISLVEEHAREVVAQAHKEAKGMIEDAHAKSDLLMKGAQNEAKDEKEHMFLEAQNKARNEAAAIRKGNDIKINKMMDAGKSKADKAIAAIKEHVLK